MPNITKRLPVRFEEPRKARACTKYQHGLELGICKAMYCRTINVQRSLCYASFNTTWSEIFCIDLLKTGFILSDDVAKIVRL